MSSLPEIPTDIAPAAFFEELLPRHFAALSGGKIRNIDGVLVARVTGEGGGAWSLSVRDGALQVRAEANTGALAYLQMDRAVWRTVMEKTTEVAQKGQGSWLGAFKFLFPEPQLVQLVKNSMTGTAEIRLKQEGTDPLSLFFGFKELRPEAPKTKVTMALSDWVDLAARKVVPAQLFMAGKATVEGDMALAMNMSMLLA
jgi:putative sterol carrier protein